MMRRSQLVVMCSLIVFALASATPAVASASPFAPPVELAPGTTVADVAVTGPGISSPVPLTAEQTIQFLKSFLAVGMFAAHIEDPPSDAEVYTVRFVATQNGNVAPGKVLLAWDGKAAWASGGALLDKKKGRFTRAPGEMIEALSAVLRTPSGDRPKPGFSGEDDDSLTGPIVAGGAVLVALGAGFVVMRRRKPSGTTKQ